MSTFTSNIIQQKLMEIKISIPPAAASLVSDNQADIDFQSVLKTESAAIDKSTTIDKSADIKSISSSNIKSPKELEAFINASSKKYNISPKIIKAVIKAESSFNANSLSGSGAIGLMQLMPATANSLGVKNPYDPAQNIDGGVKYLNYQLKRFDGNLEFALAAYNAGPGAVIKYGGIPPYKETQNYVKKIMGWINN